MALIGHWRHAVTHWPDGGERETHWGGDPAEVARVVRLLSDGLKRIAELESRIEGMVEP